MVFFDKSGWHTAARAVPEYIFNLIFGQFLTNAVEIRPGPALQIISVAGHASLFGKALRIKLFRGGGFGLLRMLLFFGHFFRIPDPFHGKKKDKGKPEYHNQHIWDYRISFQYIPPLFFRFSSVFTVPISSILTENSFERKPFHLKITVECAFILYYNKSSKKFNKVIQLQAGRKRATGKLKIIHYITIETSKMTRPRNPDKVKYSSLYAFPAISHNPQLTRSSKYKV